MDLIALYIGDYLAGATDDLDRGWSDSFWPLEMREDDYSLVMLQDVPEDIAEQLLAQGTSEQWYDDGYDAASAAAPYLVGDGEEDEEDPEDEDEDEDDEYAEYNLYVWWDEEPSNPGWYVEVYDADQQVGDSMDDDFPVDVDEFGRDEADRLRKALEEAYSGAEIGGEVRGPSAEESTGPLLRDQPAFTWHRLAYHPDHKTPRGPTAFEASWHESTHGIVVTTRDEPGARSFYVSDTGSGRRDRYLDTPIFIEEVSGLGGGRRTTNLKSRLLAAKRSVAEAKAEIELCETPEEQRRVGAEDCKRRIKNAKARIRRWEPFIEKVEPKPQNRSGGNAYDPEATENTFAGIKFQLVRTEGAGVRYWRVRNLTTGEDIEKPGHGTIFPGTTKQEKWESIARTLRLIGEERFRQEL